jgi:hypothetical protein
MTTENRAAIEQRLTLAKDEAAEKLQAAVNALETAQLQAVAAGVPVPGKLYDEVETTRRRLSECEGALAALARQGDAEAVEAQRRARADREASVAVAAEAVRLAGHELVAAVDHLIEQGAGAKLQAALANLKERCYGVGVSVLGPAGWVTSEHTRHLFTVDHHATVQSIVLKALNDHQGQARVKEYLGEFASQIVAQVKVQPPQWPAA